MKKLTALLLTLAMALTLTACGGGSGVSQREYDELQRELDKLQRELDRMRADGSGANDEPGNNIDNNQNDRRSLPYNSYNVGDTIEFGGYDWLVLDEQDGRKLIISQNVIEYRYYHSELEYITWAESDIRHYLNGEFIDNNFTEDEKNRIADTTVINNNNPWYGTYGGADTTDKVFLLSLDEVVRYFGDSGQLHNRPSDDTWYIGDAYNTDRIAYDTNGNASNWWLRSPGYFSYHAAIVYGDGIVFVYGGSVNGSNLGVRPALWLNP